MPKGPISTNKTTYLIFAFKAEPALFPLYECVIKQKNLLVYFLCLELQKALGRVWPFIMTYTLNF